MPAPQLSAAYPATDPMRRFTRPPLPLPLLLAACLALTGCGRGADTHPGQPVAKREAIFKRYLRTTEPMGMMLRGSKPFEAQRFQQLAATLKTLSTEPWQYFPVGSTYYPSRAKAAVWEKPAEFKAAQDRFTRAAAQLAEATQRGNPDVIRPAFRQLSESCNACHHEFRGPPRF